MTETKQSCRVYFFFAKAETVCQSDCDKSVCLFAKGDALIAVYHLINFPLTVLKVCCSSFFFSFYMTMTVSSSSVMCDTTRQLSVAQPE